MNWFIDPPLWLFVGYLILVFALLRLWLNADVVLSLAVGVLFSFCVAEVVCRWLELGSPVVAQWEEKKTGKDNPAPYQPNTSLVYTYPDNPRGYFDESNQVSGLINEFGYRGAAVKPTKTIDTIRMAFLGDSFTLGIGVRDGDTMPANVERLMRDDGQRVEVLNMARSGSSTPKQFAIYRDYALGFDPDVAVLGLFLNDARRKGVHQFLVYGHFLASVRQHSWFLNALVRSVERGLLHRQMLEHYLAGYQADSPEWQAMQNNLRTVKKLADEKQHRLVIVLYPVLFGLAGEYPFESIHHAIATFCREQGIEFVDFLDVYRGRDERQLWVHPTDHHPNEKAQEMAARYLADYLIGSGP